LELERDSNKRRYGTTTLLFAHLFLNGSWHLKNFGLGESSAIVFAMENPNTLMIIDDQEPKLYASEIGLNVIGTIGVIKQAVDKNIIKSKKEANELFDKIKLTGGYISDKLLQNIKYPELDMNIKHITNNVNQDILNKKNELDTREAKIKEQERYKVL